MTEFLGAGVYTQRKKSQQQTINAVSTSNYAIVGWTPRGPTNKATLIGSFAEYLRTFGSYWKYSDVANAMEGFYNNGGKRAYVVRVVPDDAESASVSTPGSEWIFNAKSEGTWGNQVRCMLRGSDNYYDAPTATYSRYDLLVQEESADGEGDWATTETWSEVDLTDPDSANYLTTVLNDPESGSDLISVEEVSGGVPAAFASEFVSGEALGTGDGSSSQTVSGSLVESPVGTFTCSVYVDGVKVAEDNGRGVISAVEGSGYTSIAGTIDYDTGAYEIVFTAAPAIGLAITIDYYKAGATSASYEMTGGVEGTEVGRSQVTNPALEADGKGLYALEEIDEILLIGLPDFYGNKTIHTDLITYGERRTDRFIILDTPRGIDTQDALNYKRITLASFSSKAAIYYPHIRVADPLKDGRVKVLSPVGHIAGCYARTDNNRNVAKAPAGTVDGAIQGILGAERVLKKSDIDVLYPAYINPIMDNASQGRALWGSRTLQNVGDFTQIPHERLFQFLDKSVYNSTQDLVFEPIGEGLFGTIKFRLEGFLGVLAGFGYFASQVPSEAFRVTVDDSNNTPATIANRLVIVDVLIAVSNPAEYILFRFERTLEPLA